MYKISRDQISIIHSQHAKGAFDNKIAAAAGVSLNTVKRHRKEFGLHHNSLSNRLGSLGEQILFDEAKTRGYRVERHKNNRDGYDLIINGLLVDVKTAELHGHNGYRLRLPARRPSFYGQYGYDKNYADDCHVIALVCIGEDDSAPTFYFFESWHARTDFTINHRNPYADFRDDWAIFDDLPVLTPTISHAVSSAIA